MDYKGENFFNLICCFVLFVVIVVFLDSSNLYRFRLIPIFSFIFLFDNYKVFIKGCIIFYKFPL